jgi:hypothetical protein
MWVPGNFRDERGNTPLLGEIPIEPVCKKINGDQPMNETPKPQEEIFKDVRELGINLKNFLIAAWNSQEREELKTAIHTNLEEVGQTLNQAATDFFESEHGRQIKSDVADLKKRAENGELENQIRKDLHDALSLISSHLESAASNFKSPSTPEAPTQTGSEPKL